MKEQNDTDKTIDTNEKNVSRRGFLKIVGVFAITTGGAGIIGCEQPTPQPLPDDPNINASMGYILVDSRKCQGCLTCMIACSLVNEGVVSLSLSRIQVAINSFACYPDDVRSTQCRQCEDPKCVEYCANGALSIDKEHGNIRVVNPEYCIGCGRCIQACPHEPKRPMIAPSELYGGELKSRKCELCLNAPYHFAPEGGGIEGVRACEAACPLGAIRFTSVMPEQEGDGGYDTNLRDNKWKQLGFDTTL